MLNGDNGDECALWLLLIGATIIVGMTCAVLWIMTPPEIGAYPHPAPPGDQMR